MRSRIRLILLLSMISCQPTISYFRAQPSTICKGNAAQLIWSASAPGKITTKQSGAVVITTHRTGSTTVSPAQRTTYRLTARSTFGTRSREVDLDVVGDANERELGASIAQASTRCQNSTLSVLAEATSEYWDSRVFAGEIAALGGRSLQIEHDGIKAEVSPDANSRAFKDVPVVGSWTISTALRNGEQCGARLPRNLGIKIFPTCSR